MTPQRARDDETGATGWLVTDKHVFLAIAVIGFLFAFRDRIMVSGRDEAQTAVALQTLTSTVSELKSTLADFTRQVQAQRTQDGDRISRLEGDMRAHLSESAIVKQQYERSAADVAARVDRLEGRRAVAGVR